MVQQKLRDDHYDTESYSIYPFFLVFHHNLFQRHGSTSLFAFCLEDLAAVEERQHIKKADRSDHHKGNTLPKRQPFNQQSMANPSLLPECSLADLASSVVLIEIRLEGI